MRIRKSKIYVFEELDTTEKSTYYIGVVIFTLLFILIWIGMYSMSTQLSNSKDFIGFIVLIGSIFSFTLILIFKGLKYGAFNESQHKSNFRLKKGKNYLNIKQVLSNQNISNHQNYFKSQKLNRILLTQLWDKAIVIGILVILFLIGFVLFFLGLGVIGPEKEIMPYLGIIIIWGIIISQIIIFIFYNIYNAFMRMYKVLKGDGVCIMKSEIKYYHIHGDKIFFY